MRGSTKKRLFLVGGAVTTVGAAAALVAGATFGFFSSAGTASGSNTFTAGKVLVGLDPSGTQVACAISPMSPGDDQTKSGVSCEYDVKYTGNVNAYMAMDLAITGAAGASIAVPYTQTTAPTAKLGLYDGTANGLQLSITDGAATPVTYFSGTQYRDQATGALTTLPLTSGSASIADLLVNATPITAASAATHVTVHYSLPIGADNSYNLATSTIVLTIHAVQADNNPATGCVAGRVCSTGMSWSLPFS
jgi:hypothetical protein